MRKAVIRLRLEMQRQQLRRESQLLVQPFRQAQGLGHNLSQQLFGGGNAALWGAGGPHCWAYCLAGRTLAASAAPGRRPGPAVARPAHAERPLKDAPTGNGRRPPPNATIELAEANR